MTSRPHSAGGLMDAPFFFRRLAAAILVIAAFVSGLVAVSLQLGQEAYRDQARATAQNLSLVLDRYISGVIDKVDLVLLSVGDEVIRQTAGGRPIDAPAFNAFLARQQEHLPELESLRVADTAGMVSYGLGVPAASRINVGDRQYFVRSRDEPKAGLVIDGPMLARISKKWVLVLARRLVRSDGSFFGVVYVNVALEHFSGVFATVDVGSGGVLSLRNRDLGLIARHPAPPDLGAAVGDRQVLPSLRDRVAAGEAAATGIDNSEGERMFSFRRIDHGPLYVTVSLVAEDYLAEWWNHAFWMWGLAALVMILAVAGGWSVQRSWRRQLAVSEQLAREEEKFHTVADYTYDWEYWQGPDGQLMFIAPACQRVTGYSAAEFITDPGLLDRIIHPDDREKMAGHRHDAGHAEEATVDFRIVRRDGEIRWIAHGCRAVFGRDRVFLGRRVSNRDVTERRQAEERVRQAYAYTRSLIEASLDPLVTIGPDGRITDVNSATEAATGYPRQMLVGTEFSEYFSEPDKARAGYQQAFRDGQVHDYALELRHRNGQLTPVLYNASVYRDANGEVVGVFAAARDVTERRRAEERVRQAYAYTRSLIEASLDPLVTIGPDGRITDVNSATEAATGYPRQMLVGTEFSEYFSEPDKARAGYQQAFRDGQVHDYALELRHRDGQLTPVLYNAAVYRDEAGVVVGVFAAARDVTERRRAETQVRQLTEELERRVVERTAQLAAANKELEDFSYSLSHDLRTPLRAIAGFAQILVEDYGDRLNDEGRRLLGVVRDNATRMGRLMDSILHFLRLGRIALRPAILDMAALAQDAFVAIQAASPERSFRLEMDALPTCRGDQAMIRELFDHLFLNAAKYTEPKAEPAVIQVGAAAAPGETVYHVRDNGIGFDMRYVDKLFRVFERVHPTGQFEGSGIGLAIVKRIVQRHGGRVWAEGREGAGATIYFTLPTRE